MARPLVPIELDIPHYVQETPVWCWAAVAQMVIAHFKGAAATPSQKEIARMALGLERDDRWSQGVPDEAVVPNDALYIRLIVKVLARRASDWYPPSTAEEIYANLYFGNPVILHVRTAPDASHVMVVSGIRPTATRGVFEVRVNDPAPDIGHPFWTTYDAVRPAVLEEMVILRDLRV